MSAILFQIELCLYMPPSYSKEKNKNVIDLSTLQFWHFTHMNIILLISLGICIIWKTSGIVLTLEYFF